MNENSKLWKSNIKKDLKKYCNLKDIDKKDLDISNIPLEILSKLQKENYLDLFGDNIWAGAYSSNWRVRF